MEQIIACTRCGEPNPADARFCINCGGSVATAPAVGPTVKLNGRVCAACLTVNPGSADFCLSCGRALDGVPLRAPVPPRVQAPPGLPRIYPRVQAPPLYVPRPARLNPPTWQPGGQEVMLAVAAIFVLIALFSGAHHFLFFFFFLPLGLMGRAFRGRDLRGLVPLLGLVGLFLLMANGLIWQGILLTGVAWMIARR